MNSLSFIAPAQAKCAISVQTFNIPTGILFYARYYYVQGTGIFYVYIFPIYMPNKSQHRFGFIQYKMGKNNNIIRRCVLRKRVIIRIIYYIRADKVCSYQQVVRVYKMG